MKIGKTLTSTYRHTVHICAHTYACSYTDDHVLNVLTHMHSHTQTHIPTYWIHIQLMHPCTYKYTYANAHSLTLKESYAKTDEELINNVSTRESTCGVEI